MALAQAQMSATDDGSAAKRSGRGGGGSFFKKKTARRAKSLGKDHWDDVVFGECCGRPVTLDGPPVGATSEDQFAFNKKALFWRFPFSVGISSSAFRTNSSRKILTSTGG